MRIVFERSVLEAPQLIAALRDRVSQLEIVRPERLHLTCLYVGEEQSLLAELIDTGASNVSKTHEKLHELIGAAPTILAPYRRSQITGIDTYHGPSPMARVAEVQLTQPLESDRHYLWNGLVAAISAAGIAHPVQFLAQSKTINMPSRHWRPHVTLQRSFTPMHVDFDEPLDVTFGPVQLHR